MTTRKTRSIKYPWLRAREVILYYLIEAAETRKKTQRRSRQNLHLETREEADSDWSPGSVSKDCYSQPRQTGLDSWVIEGCKNKLYFLSNCSY